MEDGSQPLESVLPPDLLSRCLQEAGVWQLEGNGVTVGPWSVSKTWRDCFWNDPGWPELLAHALLARHAGREALRRAVCCCRSARVDRDTLVCSVFERLHAHGIQQRGFIGTVDFNNPDDELHSLTHVDELFVPSASLRIVSVRIACSWVDQGWGNLKGRLVLLLRRLGNTGGWRSVEGSALDLFGIASHERRNESAVLDAAQAKFRSCILDRQLPGDQLCLHYAVGGGGGHSLHISDLRFAVAHSDEAAALLSSADLDGPLFDWGHFIIDLRMDRPWHAGSDDDDDDDDDDQGDELDEDNSSVYSDDEA